MSSLRIRWSRFGKQERLYKRIRKISSVGIRSIPTLERFFRHLKFKQLKQHKMIDETVLYHLNHRMMTVLISPDVIESKPYPAIYDYI
jgi:hypothetical protein